MSSILDEIRRDLRKKSNSLDGEIEALIEAAKCDLELSGIDSEKKKADGDDIDPLIYTAIKLYCKGNFGYDDQSGTYKTAYENLKIALASSFEYRKQE
ncbi:MAG: phage gp6-like head-tail connector protein [Lachnospira sp.]|nr:phage gp6-like head-tail connector protein [Lachnospira sp.]